MTSRWTACRWDLVFKGDDEGQADLMIAMVMDGLRVKAFEERGSSFEDILVEVAENNRKEE